MKLKISKIIRILTVTPLMAFFTLCLLRFFKPDIFDGRILPFVLSVCFLTVLPLLAYPLQPFVPHFKDKGREGQRTLAMIFAVSGYILGCITNLFFASSVFLWLIYLEYLISGICILVLNKVFHLRASAHACGIAGPTVMLAYFGIPVVFIVCGAVLYISAFFASIAMKRHTLLQYLGGTAVPIAVLIALNIILL